MKRFEYMDTYFKSIDMLNIFGLQGWELISALPQEHNYLPLKLIFKRENV